MARDGIGTTPEGIPLPHPSMGGSEYVLHNRVAGFSHCCLFRNATQVMIHVVFSLSAASSSSEFALPIALTQMWASQLSDLYDLPILGGRDKGLHVRVGLRQCDFTKGFRRQWGN